MANDLVESRFFELHGEINALSHLQSKRTIVLLLWVTLTLQTSTSTSERKIESASFNGSGNEISNRSNN